MNPVTQIDREKVLPWAGSLGHLYVLVVDQDPDEFGCTRFTRLECNDLQSAANEARKPENTNPRLYRRGKRRGAWRAVRL